MDPVVVGAALIFFLAAFIQGVTGFGAGLIAVPLLSIFLDIKIAVPLTLLNGLVMTGFLSVELRSRINWRRFLLLSLGALPGVLLGVAFLKVIPPGPLKLLLAMMLIGFSIYSLMNRIQTRPIHSAWGLLAGFATGFLGAATSAGGPPVVIYSTLVGSSRDDFKATLSFFFLAGGVAIAIGHALSGTTTAFVLRLFALTVTFVLAGVYAGSLLYGRLNREGYRKVILFALLVMGLIMLGSLFD